MMNPLTGRFWNADTYEGNGADPVSLHKYLYANADPANEWDPSGNYSLAETLNAVRITAQLATIRIAPVATKLVWFAYEGVTGISLVGAPVALGVAGAAPKLPGGTSVNSLLAIAIRLPKEMAIGLHKAVKKLVSGSGFQSNHINQSAAFPLQAVDDAVTIALKGGVDEVGSQHWQFHRVLEDFWNKFRNTPLNPSNAQYDQALREALLRSSVPPGTIEDLAQMADRARRAVGYFDGPGGLPPIVPAKIPGF